MKKTVKILMMGVVCMFLFGCGEKSYNVDYHGQESLFGGAEKSFREGTEVVLTYDLIATDTDYYFYVDGEEINAKWDEKKGYVLKFVMPDHDIEVYCRKHNSMANTIWNDAVEEETDGESTGSESE